MKDFLDLPPKLGKNINNEKKTLNYSKSKI